MRKKRHLLSYLAGIFDEEGYVSISKKANQEGEYIYYGVKLQVQMTDPSIPQLFQHTFGGNLSIWMDKKRTKPMHRWRCHTDNLIDIIRCLLPYTILKTPQLEVALHFLTHTQRRGQNREPQKLSNAELLLREADLILCKNLKKEVF